MTSGKSNRREFLRTASHGAAVAGSGLGFLANLPRVHADDAQVKGKLVSLGDEVEPLVRLIEDSDRGALLGKVAEQIRQGTSYRKVLAALLLAGVRNVQPRPSVGFKFHCVLVVNSCHLASLYGPDQDRWLPIFWALDYFKSSQADEKRRSGWRLKPVNESLVPDGPGAVKMFTEAMDTWDEEKADAATAGLTRSVGATRVFNLFARYAARDYRSIGHKAIYLANAWRTLEVIGWEFAEPVMRSLAFALLNHNGQPNPSKSDLSADRPWRQNLEKSKSIPAGWLDGKIDSSATGDVIQGFRSATSAAVSDTAVAAMKSGVAAQSIWDGVFVGAGELLMQQPGIIGLHGLTTANALHYLYQHTADESIRQRILLQACSFGPMFRSSAKGRGKISTTTIDAFTDSKDAPKPNDARQKIFAEISSNRMDAAQKTYQYLQHGGSPLTWIDDARRMLFLKGRDAHDYKFSSAVLEDFAHISPKWRDLFLSMSVFNLRGSGHGDSPLVAKTRAALT